MKTVIVLLILAGVSLNAIIGENGIITNAQKATILQSCAELEEFIQEFYVDHFDSLPQNAESKVEALEIYSVSKNYFWNPSLNGYGSLGYIVTADGYKCYFINKSGLPDEIKKNLRGGDAGNGTYSDYAGMNDVYGITTDLKVYYCSKGHDSIMGITLADLEKDDPNRTVFSKDSNDGEKNSDLKKAMYSFLEKYDTDADGVLSSKEIRAVNSITIKPTDNITSFSELYSLTSLNTIKLEGISTDNLDGFSLLPMLSEITFENCVIGNYDDMSGVLNLKFLCFIFNDNSIDSNTEIKKLCGTNEDEHLGISKAELKNLKRLAITGSMLNDGNTETLSSFKANISDLSALSNLSGVTKGSIQTLNFQNTMLTGINFLDGFTGVTYLNVGCSNIKNLKGIESCSSLETLDLYDVTSLGIEDGSNIEDKNNALYNIQFCSKLKDIDFGNSSDRVKYISYVLKLPSLERVFFGQSVYIDMDDMIKCVNFFKSLKKGYSVAARYSILFLDINSTSINLGAISVTENVFRSLVAYSKVKNVLLDSCVITDNDGRPLADAKQNEIINDVLAKFPLLEAVDVCGTKISTLDFIYDNTTKKINTPKLCVVHALNTSITDFSVLERLTIYGLAINNENINLNLIQKTISSCISSRGFGHGFGGFFSNNANLWKKLENCSEITSISSYCANWKLNFTDVDINLSNLKNLKTLDLKQVNFKSLTLPNCLESLTLVDCNLVPNLSKCSLLNYIKIEKGGLHDIHRELTNISDCLKTKVLNNEVVTKIYLSGLSGLENLIDIGDKFNCDYIEIKNCSNLSSLEGISSMSNLLEINCVDNPALVNIIGVGTLTELTNLTLEGCGIVNLSEIRNLSSLNDINLKNNPLFNRDGDTDNLEILVNLRTKKASIKIYLTGCNNILDWSKLSNFGSWWHDEEKSGY